MNMQKMLKQAQKMQDKIQQQLQDTAVEASVGGGMLTVKMDGNKRLLAVQLDPEAMDSSDSGMLEDLILAAVNEANRKVDEALQQSVGSLAGNVPGLF